MCFAVAFAAAWTVTSAMAAHLPRIVEVFGVTPAQAVFAGMMIGPAQAAARVLEASTLGRFHPLFSTRLACITHPVGVCVIGIFGGACRRGACPCCTARAMACSRSHEERCRWRSSVPRTTDIGLGYWTHRPASVRRVAPLGFSFLIDAFSGGVVVASSMLSLVAFGALLLIPMSTAKGAISDAPAKQAR
jgi:hypothetical protein